jgi:hypothetical protein
MFFLYLDRLLVGCRRYLISLAIIASFVLTNALGIINIIGIRDSYTTARLAIKINRFLTAGTRGYLVSIIS